MKNYQKNTLNINLDIAKGLYVTGVLTDFIGNYIGIKEGDIIVSLNGQAVNTIDEFIKAEYTVANEVEVKVLRQGQELTFKGLINHD